MGHGSHSPKQDSRQHAHHYQRLAVMGVLSFVAMFILMYAMVDRLTNVYGNLNQAYMAGLMTAPMIMIELLVMGRCIRTRGSTSPSCS